MKIAGSVTYRFLLLFEERITPNESNVHQYHIYGPSSGAPLGGIVGHAVDYQKAMGWTEGWDWLNVMSRLPG